MDQAPPNVKSEAEQPENQQDRKNRPEHEERAFLVLTLRGTAGSGGCLPGRHGPYHERFEHLTGVLMASVTKATHAIIVRPKDEAPSKNGQGS